MMRTHYCAEPNLEFLDKEVVLCGWVNSRRDHGSLIFIDLRDRTGVIQIVVNPEISEASHKIAQDIKDEYVLLVKGKVSKRPSGTENENLKTGDIEIIITEIEILNSSKVLPFQIKDDIDVAEEIRFKYRYLDLRRPKIFNIFSMRNKISFLIREFFDKHGFLEVETPLLIKSTPEGARDYLVPSRINIGEFYALPQSPQMLKQVLMVSGFDRYFQLAKCFRDEDLRAERQPEFTQIDIEMSFIDETDILKLIEEMIVHVFKISLNIDIKIPFPKITYNEAMLTYGSDKPDLRYKMELVDITEKVSTTEYKIFANVIKNGGVIRGLNVKNCSNFSRQEIDELINFVKNFGAKGITWFKVVSDELESPVAKFFDNEDLKNIKDAFSAVNDDLILIIGDSLQIVTQSLDFLRRHLANKLNLIPKDTFVFEWLIDFPLFKWNEEEKRFEPEHHPFTSPKFTDIEYLDKDLSKVKARAYDLVLNGVEIGGGSIRIHKRDIQEKIFKAIGISKDEAKEKFGFLLEAFEYGTPPHGGIALGLDRLIKLMLNEDSIRDVIIFPKTQKAQCLLTSAPSKVDEKQLRELHLKVNLPPKDIAK
ncbi:MAG: aspartate--tRNA ligase [Candidatus Firestonebacteria bacterium]